MYTSAGDWALRDSFPEKDSGVAKQLRAHGVVILGKLGLSEWANSFGSQPSGFSNLTGQVLNANDMAQGPSGSSSGSGAAGDAALAALTIGTETSGSIISPSNAQSLVGLRPTLGLVPGYGIAPILASQDTAGPMVRTVTDAAMTLQSIAEIPGADPEANAEYEGIMGPHWLENGDITPAPYTTLPNYLDALDLNFVKGKRIGYNGNTCTPAPCTPSDTQKAVQKAKEVLEAAGAIMVEDTAPTLPTLPALPPNYEAHATIDSYYAHLGDSVPLHNLVEEVASDDTNPQEGEKDGISTHRRESLVPLRGEGATGPGGKPEGTENAEAYEKVLPERKAIYHAAIEGMMNAPSGGGGPVIAVIGSVPSGPQAGLPQIAVPMGYSPTQRRNVGISVNGGAYDEFDLLGVAYVIEQGTKLRKGVGEVNPAAYRCAHTAIPAPFAERGHCNPDYGSTLEAAGGEQTILPFSLETTSATELEDMMEAGDLTSEELVKAELTRIALTNAHGISTQSVRALAPEALADAQAADAARAGGAEGPLLGIPFLVDDSIDVDGLATSGGSIALQDNLPAADSTLVAKLKAAGAVVLGDTNTSELGGVMEGSNMPQGYSSLGGQALLPADTNKNVGGSSGGSAGAVSVGLAPLAIGLETSPEASRAIVPAENAGLVAIKPTVGLVSRAGVMPTARSQESPTPMAQSVADVAAQLDVLAGPDPADPVTETQPSPVPDYSAGLVPTALAGDKIATVAVKATASERSAAEQVYVAATEAATSAGATTEVVTPGTAATAPSVIPYELHRDLDSFLAATPGGGSESLQGIIEYDKAHPVEGLKYGQAGLIAAQATSIGGEKTTYETNLATGRTESKAVINATLTGGKVALMVPSGSALVAIADRAGYPVLTLPAGFGLQDSSTGADPIGVDLIGVEYSEAELLADAFALEAKLEARQKGPAYMRAGSIVAPQFSGVPSMTNPGMFRCTPGSAYYNPYDCNPEVVELHGNPPSGGGGGGQGGGGGDTTTPPESPAPPAPKPELKPGKTAKLLPGKGTALLTIQVSGPGKLVLSGAGVKKVTAHPKKAGPVKLTVKAVGAKAKTLAKTGKVTVHLKLVFTAADGSTVTTTKTVTLKKKV
jgi:Asp-tRNA(Asn)/Glu-tRNA(Gln) amidotransferase A subunit family amidase